MLPTEHIQLRIVEAHVPIPLCRPHFTLYTGSELPHTFGGKGLLDVDSRAQFAEVAILRAFEADGWQSRWLETYGKGKLTPGLWNAWHPDGPSAQIHLPIAEAWVNERLASIAAANNNSYSGCWDVVAWKDHRLVFAESKKQKKDRMRGTQLRWLEAALSVGCSVQDFLVVEWTAA